MTNKKTTRALLLAAVAAMLCASMLIGTTFAWFTDSVSSVNNIIKSGNLDIEVEYSSDLSDWKTFEEGVNVFDEEALWEPGYTEVVYFRVKNAGSLALKYWMDVQVFEETSSINVAGEEFYLSNFIKYGVVALDDETPVTFADRDAAHSAVVQDSFWINRAYSKRDIALDVDESDYIALVVYMPTTVENDANHAKDVDAPTITLGITLRATQNTVEFDSFDEKYDEGANYPVNPNGVNWVYTEEDLKQGGKLKLAQDLYLSSSGTVIDKDTELDLNGFGIYAERNAIGSYTGQSISVLYVDGAELTITGKGEVVNTGVEGGYAISLFNDAKVTLNDGARYISYHDAIYVKNGELYINGGFYQAKSDTKATADYVHAAYPDKPTFTAIVINCYKPAYNNYKNGVTEGDVAKVVITGGTFVNEDPTNVVEGDFICESFAPAGYKSVAAPQADGSIWYTVVAE